MRRYFECNLVKGRIGTAYYGCSVIAKCVHISTHGFRTHKTIYSSIWVIWNNLQIGSKHTTRGNAQKRKFRSAKEQVRAVFGDLDCRNISGNFKIQIYHMLLLIFPTRVYVILHSMTIYPNPIVSLDQSYPWLKMDPKSYH